jgi:cysteine synthase A
MSMGERPLPRLAASVLDCIGATPLVHLRRIHPGPGRLLAKAEFLNPGGSMKDRAAVQIVRDAEADGRLAPGQAIVEMTSGNMGAGLAIACSATDHPFIAVMSRGNTPVRKAQMEALGAKVVLVDQVDGAPGRVTGADIDAAVAEARRIAEQQGAFYVDQFNSRSSARAHEQTTGPEIWRQAGGRVDAFVCIVGTGASLTGTAAFLKSVSPHVRIYAVEPTTSRPLAGLPVERAQHLLQGTSYGTVPPLCRSFKADGYLAVSDDEATHYRQALGSREGLFVGYSAAANVCAAVHLLRSGALAPNATVATLLCDSGMKYG